MLYNSNSLSPIFIILSEEMTLRMKNKADTNL